MIDYENEEGTVTLDRPVFAMIALKSAQEQEGIYAVSNARGKVMKHNAGETGREGLGFIEVSQPEGGEGVNIKIYVVMKFGSSISRAAFRYGKEVRRKVKEITGVEVADLTFAVTGIKSKNIASRELEIHC